MTSGEADLHPRRIQLWGGHRELLSVGVKGIGRKAGCRKGVSQEFRRVPQSRFRGGTCLEVGQVLMKV